MSLRLVKPGLSAAFPVHSTMRHPHTGEPLRAIGIIKGKPIWPFMGASPDDQGGAGGDGGGSGSDGGGQQGGTGATGGDDKGGDDVDGLKARIAALEDEKNRHYSRRSEAEKELETLRKFKNDLENASKSDLEKAQGEVTRLTNDLAKLADLNKELTLKNAFLSSNKITWHNPEEALKLADLSAVDVKPDGTVDTKALEAALVNLSNKSKHLVKADDGSGSSDDGKGNGQGSGSDMNGRRKGDKGDDKPPTREELAKKFPALNAFR